MCHRVHGDTALTRRVAVGRGQGGTGPAVRHGMPSSAAEAQPGYPCIKWLFYVATVLFIVWLVFLLLNRFRT
jgi:hypothetical protein